MTTSMIKKNNFRTGYCVNDEVKKTTTASSALAFD